MFLWGFKVCIHNYLYKNHMDFGCSFNRLFLKLWFSSPFLLEIYLKSQYLLSLEEFLHKFQVLLSQAKNFENMIDIISLQILLIYRSNSIINREHSNWFSKNEFSKHIFLSNISHKTKVKGSENSANQLTKKKKLCFIHVIVSRTPLI